MADPEKTEEVQTEEQIEAQAEAEAQAEVEVEVEAAGEVEDQEPKTVSYERFQEMVDKVKGLEGQVEVANQQMALARANPVQGQQVQAPQFDIFKEVGLEDEDDMPNVKQHRQILEHYGKVFDSRLAEIAFHQAHSDYADLVGTADEIMSGKYAEPLAAAIKQNPALLTMIAKSGDPRLAAYEIAKLQKTRTADKPVKAKDAKAAIDEAVENAARVKSSANIKGGGALSEEGRYEGMSDADFLKLALSHGAIV